MLGTAGRVRLALGTAGRVRLALGTAGRVRLALGTEDRKTTVCFGEEGGKVEPDGICGGYDTGCPFPAFAIAKPALESTRVDMSPYGQSIFADAVDAVQAVDPTASWWSMAAR